MSAVLADTQAVSDSAETVGAAQAALAWVDATLADPAASAMTLWTRSISEASGPGAASAYEHDIDGWTIRISEISYSHVSGYGSYISAGTYTRYVLGVIDPDGDVRDAMTGDGDSGLSDTFRHVGEAHDLQGKQATTAFRDLLLRRTAELPGLE